MMNSVIFRIIGIIFVLTMTVNGFANKALSSTKASQTSIDTQAAKILKESFAVYNSCKSYQHEAELAMTFTVKGKTQTHKKTIKLLVEKPNRIFFQWVSFVLTSDGKQMQIYFVPLQQYIIKPAPKTLTHKDISDTIMEENLTPILTAIYDSNAFNIFTRKAKSVKYLGETNLNNKKYYKIEITRTGGQEQLLIDQSSHLIKQIIFKPDSKSSKKWTLTITYKKIKMNEPIAQSEFVITPPEDARKVERFSFTRWFGYPMEGKTLPDATLVDLNSGKEISVKSLMGKSVTFVTFWASWCPPCRKELPELQKLYKKYKDTGFQIIAISLDNKSSVKRAKEFVKQHNLTFPVLNDNSGKLANPLNVSSIPTMLIVNSKGTIVEAHQGFNPQGEKEFSAIIEKLTKQKKK